jgi:hypothetical protein
MAMRAGAEPHLRLDTDSSDDRDHAVNQDRVAEEATHYRA